MTLICIRCRRHLNRHKLSVGVAFFAHLHTSAPRVRHVRSAPRHSCSVRLGFELQTAGRRPGGPASLSVSSGWRITDHRSCHGHGVQPNINDVGDRSLQPPYSRISGQRLGSHSGVWCQGQASEFASRNIKQQECGKVSSSRRVLSQQAR